MARKSAKKPAGNKGKKKKTADHGVDGNIEDSLEMIEEEDWDETPEQGGSFDDVPDGKYQVRVKEVALNNAKSSGRFQISWQLQVCSGEQANRVLFKHDGLDDEQNRGYARSGLARLGIEWPKKADLAETLAELVGTFLQITAMGMDQRPIPAPTSSTVSSGSSRPRTNCINGSSLSRCCFSSV